MLFMDVSTWAPEHRGDILKHFKELRPPAGVHVVNQWVDLTGGRYFILYEAESSEAYAAFNLPWSDVCKIDSVPVMEATEFIKHLTERGIKL